MWKAANSCFWGQQSHRLSLVLLKWMNQTGSRLQKLLFLAGEYSCLPSTIELCSYSFTSLNFFSSKSWNICCVTSCKFPSQYILWILQSRSRHMTVLFTEVSHLPHCVCMSPAYTHRKPCIITSLQLVKSFTSVIYYSALHNLMIKEFSISWQSHTYISQPHKWVELMGQKGCLSGIPSQANRLTVSVSQAAS